MSPVLAPWAGRGSPAAARRMARGIWLLNDQMIETAPGAVPWDDRLLSQQWVDYIHGQSWLDDFAALRDEMSWCAGARWTHEWIEEFGSGWGTGWTMQLAARRQIRWLCHRGLLLSQASDREAARFLRVLGRQARFLAWRWRWSPVGLARLEALAGHLLSLIEGPDRGQVRFLKAAFGREAAKIVGSEEQLLGRNPANLLRLVDLLSAMASSLEGVGHTLDQRHANALAHFGPRLAALCHGDGRLARFHGAAAGRLGDASRVLEQLGSPKVFPERVLGYGRLDCAESALIIDAAPGSRFASALAIEFSCGKQPLLVNSGCGLGFGVEAQRAARQTQAHSTMSLFGSSHDLNPATECTGRPEMTVCKDGSSGWLIALSDAWRASHGVGYRRRLRLSQNGLSLQGEELVRPQTNEDRHRFAKLLKRAGQGPTFEVRFILHPSVQVLHGARAGEMCLRLPNEQRWRLRCRDAVLSTEAALFYDSARLHRRATKTIVASGRFLEYLGRITWSLEAVLPS
ncbi:MAG: heparinase II/III family protein [Pseudomonadota bacterium]